MARHHEGGSEIKVTSWHIGDESEFDFRTVHDTASSTSAAVADDEPDEFVFGTELPAGDGYVITSVEHSATNDISPWTVTHGGGGS